MTATDNAGLLIAELFRPPSTGTSNHVMQDIDGGFQSIRLYGSSNSTQSMFRSVYNSYMQIGKGSSVKTRQDFAIEDPFSNAPESGLNFSAQSGYINGSGLVTIGVTIAPTGGSGTITESVKISSCTTNAVTIKFFCYFSDSVPPATFIAGQSIFLEYQLQF
jgi:hypothetical protein